MTTIAPAMSKGRYLAKAMVMTFSSLLSLFGSLSIIYLTKFKRRHRLYHRLLYWLSWADVIFSMSFIFQPWMIPEFYPSIPIHTRMGTTLGCTIIGAFFTSSAMAVALLHCFMSVSFHLIIVKGIKEELVVRRYERLWYGITLFIPTCFTITSLVTRSFNPESFIGVCSFDGNASRNAFYGPQIGYAWVGVVCVASAIGFVATHRVYRMVQVPSPVPPNQSPSEATAVTTTATTTTTTMEGTTMGSYNHHHNIHIQHPMDSKDDDDDDDDDDSSSSSSSHSTRSQSSHASPPSPPHVLQPPPTLRSSLASLATTSSSSPSFSSPASSSSSSSYTRLVQTVSMQAVLYSVAYFNTMIWPIAVAVLSGAYQKRMGDWYALDLLAWFFYPLQGFWNLIIYIRPSYLQWQHRYPTCTNYWIIQQLYRHRLQPPPRASARRRNCNNQNQNQKNQYGRADGAGAACHPGAAVVAPVVAAAAGGGGGGDSSCRPNVVGSGGSGGGRARAISDPQSSKQWETLSPNEEDEDEDGGTITWSSSLMRIFNGTTNIDTSSSASDRGSEMVGVSPVEETKESFPDLERNTTIDTCTTVTATPTATATATATTNDMTRGGGGNGTGTGGGMVAVMLGLTSWGRMEEDVSTTTLVSNVTIYFQDDEEDQQQQHQQQEHEQQQSQQLQADTEKDVQLQSIMTTTPTSTEESAFESNPQDPQD